MLIIGICYDYARWYIGGYSLGGAMAVDYASDHCESLSGVILLAAYPTKPLDDNLFLISIYGSEDGVLNRTKMTEEKQNVREQYAEYVIKGGNHAQFGNYGKQKGDGEASITHHLRNKIELLMH